MSKSSIVIDLDNPKTALVAEALSNKTCIKILGLLAEKELTAGDIAGNLGIPLNTTGYNLDKLISSGLVEKSSNFFWSVKGKKTPVYKVANKQIVISPKRATRGIVPAIIASAVLGLFLRSYSYSSANEISNKALAESAQATVLAANSAVAGNVSIASFGWIFFIAGALFSIAIALIFDWMSSRRSIK